MPSRPVTPPGVLGVTRRPTRREWRRALLTFAVGMVALTLVVIFVRPHSDLLPVGSAAPGVKLESVTGGTVNVATAAAGRPYVLEFFEAGCAHCQQVASQLCHESVPVFAVDAAKESASTVAAYRRQYAPGCAYPMLLDPALGVTGAFGVTAVPTVYLVVNGRVSYAGAGLDGVANLGPAVTRAAGG